MLAHAADGPQAGGAEAHVTADGRAAAMAAARADTAMRAGGKTNPLKASRRWPSGPWWSSSACSCVLGRFAWKPLLEALHQREQHLQHVLEETERARNESEALLAEHRRQMARAADEVRAILDKARQDAQATAEQIVKQAQDEAEAARQRAQRDIATARDQALAEIWRRPPTWPSSVAGRVLSKRARPTTTIAGCSTRPSASCPPPARQRPRRDATHDRRSCSRDPGTTAAGPATIPSIAVARRYAEALIERGREGGPGRRGARRAGRDRPRRPQAHSPVRAAPGLGPGPGRPRRIASSVELFDGRASEPGPAVPPRAQSPRPARRCSRPIVARGPGDLGPAQPADPGLVRSAVPLDEGQMQALRDRLARTGRRHARS